MELRQLEYRVAVVEEASFTRAAARVHVAQPGVSAQVRRLERELGQALLDRSGRTVRLTDVGAAVLPYARAALDAVSGVRLAVEELTGLMRAHVNVGMVVACAALDLPDLLAGFHRDHPAIEISLSEANSDRLIGALRSGQLDLAVVAPGLATPPQIATQIIADEPLVAVVGHRDPLAGRSTITLRALSDRALISLPLGTGLRSCLDEACVAAGVGRASRSRPPTRTSSRGSPAEASASPSCRGRSRTLIGPRCARSRSPVHACEAAWRSPGEPRVRAVPPPRRSSRTPRPSWWALRPADHNRRDDRQAAARQRAGLPGVEEREAWGHPRFRVSAQRLPTA